MQAGCGGRRDGWGQWAEWGGGDRMGAASVAGDESCHERWGSLNMSNNKMIQTFNSLRYKHFLSIKTLVGKIVNAEFRQENWVK